MGVNRRHFLSLASTGMGTLAFPTLAQAAHTDKKLGVALLGLGNYSSSILAPALQLTRYCELRGIITGSPSKVPSWQSRYGIGEGSVYSYADMHRIEDNNDIDVVYVVTPTATHLRFAIAAAQAGKHVWCEKPMAMTVEDCQTMIDACRKNGVYLSIGYRMQHEPNSMALSKFSRTKPFGAIKELSSFAGYSGRAGSPDNWRMQKKMGGGAIYDMGVYAINGARFQSGMEPIAVKANIEPVKGFDEVDATTYFTLKFDNGLEADCGASVVDGFNHLRVTCKTGWYELKPMQSYSGVRGETSAGKIYPPFSGNQQALQMDNDAHAILTNQPIKVPGEEGLKDIRIVRAVLKSAHSDQGYVDI